MAHRYLTILGEQERPLKFLASRLLMRTGLCRVFVVRCEGYRLRFHNASLAAALWVDSGARNADELFFRRCLRAGDRVVDVGANVGNLTLLAAHLVSSEGEVTAIEAHPRIFGYLEENVRLNRAGNVRLLNLAVGNGSGVVRFSDQRSDDQNHVLGRGAGIDVPLRPLDALLSGDAPIALLKIDVEGYERAVLGGAQATLRRTRCVYFESWDAHFQRFGYDTTAVLLLLAELGFTTFRHEGDANLVELQTGYRSRVCENLVALQDAEGFARARGFRLSGRG